jgi:Fic family protein
MKRCARSFHRRSLQTHPFALMVYKSFWSRRIRQSAGSTDWHPCYQTFRSSFMHTFAKKRCSRQIEGTQSSLSDLLLFENDEAPGAPIEDVQEVSNYVAAMTHGLDRLRSGFPLSLRLIREIHEILLSKGRGSGRQPIQFRQSQNWIGGSRPGNAAFVPPLPNS